jgi:hypothetical protein
MLELTVLAVPGCPNEPVLRVRLAQVLSGYPDATVTRRVIQDEAGAARHGMGSRHHPARKQRLGSRSGNGSVRCRSWSPAPGGWVGGGDVVCDGFGSGAGVALEGPDGGVPGPGEQHRGAGAVFGLVGEKAVPELVKGPAVHLL